MDKKFKCSKYSQTSCAGMIYVRFVIVAMALNIYTCCLQQYCVLDTIIGTATMSVSEY
jgi:hypothetical protein